MFQAAARLSGLRESVIREMTRLAIQHNAVNMAQGIPDFPPPPEIIEAAHRALDDGANQYAITWGSKNLREGISTHMDRWYGLTYDPDQHVTVTCGVTEAIIAAVVCLVNPGEELVIVEPFHENYLAAAVFSQARPVFVALEPPNYELDLDKLRQVFNDKTKAIILNTPHNPTGRVFTREEMEGLAKLCQEFNVVVITDEIYDHMTYDGRPHIPMAGIDGMYDRTITIGGMGKTFAVTGWRLGYACTPEPFSTALRTVHDFTTICAPAPLQQAAVAALQLPDTFYEELQDAFTKRRARMMSILDRFGFQARMPQGAYYVMSDYEAWDFAGDDYAFADYLTKEVGVAVVPGSSFYNTPGLGDRLIRWAFAKRPETFDEVERRLQNRSAA